MLSLPTLSCTRKCRAEQSLASHHHGFFLTACNARSDVLYGSTVQGPEQYLDGVQTICHALRVRGYHNVRGEQRLEASLPHYPDVCYPPGDDLKLAQFDMQ
jgi:hypothetical protein